MQTDGFTWLFFYMAFMNPPVPQDTKMAINYLHDGRYQIRQAAERYLMTKLDRASVIAVEQLNDKTKDREVKYACKKILHKMFDVQFGRRAVPGFVNLNYEPPNVRQVYGEWCSEYSIKAHVMYNNKYSGYLPAIKPPEDYSWQWYRQIMTKWWIRDMIRLGIPRQKLVYELGRMVKFNDRFGMSPD